MYPRAGSAVFCDMTPTNRKRAPWLCAAAVLLAAAPAVAQTEDTEEEPDEEIDVEPATISEDSLAMGSTISYSADMRTNANKTLLMPGGSYQFGSELSFVTSSVGGDEARLRFTDVVMMRPRARYSFGGKLEMFAGVDVLAKQPSAMEENIVQSSHAGARFALGEDYAGWLGLGGGVMTADLGNWATIDTGVQWRKSIERYAAFQGRFGGSGTALVFDEDTDEPFWFAEALVSGEALFYAPNGIAGAWIGVDFHVPIASNPGEPDPTAGNMYLDPQTRVDFRIGTVLSAIEKWDLYAELAVVDRGDIEDPATTLPVVDGGFDQTQLTLGVIRRFNLDERPNSTMLAY